jgi:serine/threonine protein phosphatase PrpC
VTASTATLRWASATHVGRIRTNNEDSALVLDRLFVVADGMGGHQAGEVASQLAVRTLEDTFNQIEGKPDVEALVGAVSKANLAIIEESVSNPDHRGMGTTITALAPVGEDDDEELLILNVGDSRTYRLHDGELEQLTEDHSLVQEMVRDGRLSPEEAAVHPQRNIVTRALGVDTEIDVDWLTVTPYTGDRFLLASDGLFDEINDAAIAGVLRKVDDPEKAAEELVRLAIEAGGRDNVTVVVVDVVDDGGRAARASEAVDSDATRAIPIISTASASLPPTTDEAPPVEPSAPAAPAAEPEERSKRSRLTWRVAVFGAVVLVIGLVAAGAIWWQGRNTYFVGFDADDEVVVFRGRPGGVLWLDPTVEEATGIERREVPPFRRRAIEVGVQRATLEAARLWVANLEEQIEESTTTTSTTTTTTTTTTAPPVSAVPPPAPPPGG